MENGQGQYGVDPRIIVLLINRLSARTLQARDWKIYLGTDQVRLKAIPANKTDPKVPDNEGFALE